MQHRDDKPGITNPGRITTFGGTVDAGETPLEAAVRELGEETNLHFTAAELTPFMNIELPISIHGFPTTAYYFMTPPVDTTNLEVYEGQGYKIVADQAAADKLDMSWAAQQAVAAYFAAYPPSGRSNPAN